MTTRILGGKGNRGRRSQKTSCRATTSRRPPTRYERSHTRKVNLCIIQVACSLERKGAAKDGAPRPPRGAALATKVRVHLKKLLIASRSEASTHRVAVRFNRVSQTAIRIRSWGRVTCEMTYQIFGNGLFVSIRPAFGSARHRARVTNERRPRAPQPDSCLLATSSLSSIPKPGPAGGVMNPFSNLIGSTNISPWRSFVLNS